MSVLKSYASRQKREVSSIRELCENLEMSAQAHSTIKLSLEESLTLTNQVKKELGQKNAQLRST